MEITLDEQYDVEEKPTVMLYTDIFVASHIQRTSSQPENNYFTRCPIPLVVCSTRKREQKKKYGSIPPPPTHTHTHRSFGEKNNTKNITRRIYRRYAGLGRSCVRTRTSSARRLGTRPMGVASQNSTLPSAITSSQSRCVSHLLAMSSRVYLLFPPRGHEPPPTLRDHLNPHLSL